MKKKLTFPLIVLVLLLWGAIFYRIFAGIGEERGGIPMPAPLPPKESLTEQIRDDSLLLGYRDPFLERTEDLSPAEEDSLATGDYGFVEEAPYIDWSQVQYFGSVDGGAKGKTVALVGIGGREYMMKPGETVEGYTIVGQVGNSIAVSYQGQIGTITMQGNNEIPYP